MAIKETERIVNISELEEMIRNTRLKIISLRKFAEEAGENEVAVILANIQSDLFKCENFEFLLERRTIRE